MLEVVLREMEKHLGLVASREEQGLLGPIRLQVTEQLSVWVKELQPGVVLKSVISPLGLGGDLETVFMYLMSANYLGQGTGKGVIALDPDEKFLTLARIIPYELNYRIFRDALEDFVNYLEFWKTELKRLETRQI